MVPPWVVVEDIEEGSVTLRNPEADCRLRMTRAVYDLIRSFYRPATIATVLPRTAPQRERKLACLAMLRERGLLVPRSAVMPESE